jgi:Kef-type K+ transport system membrane component KefB
MRKYSLYFKQLHRRPAMLLAWVAAILYSSWPLGFVLNPFVGHHDLASQLEAPHQPYNWVFILMDVMTGLLVTVVAIMQTNRPNARKYIKWCVLGYFAFGFLVALAALTPLNCNPTADTCGPVLRNPQLIIHGGASILSVAFLFISTIALSASAFYENLKAARWALTVVLMAWIVFGFGALLELHWHITSNGLQEFFITVCSISIVLVVGVIEYLHILEKDVGPALESTKM